MNVGRICTAVVITLVCIGVQVLHMFILSRWKEDFLIVTIIIFLFNVLFPAITIYNLLMAKGLI